MALPPMISHLVVWGTYDANLPRTRIMLDGAALEHLAVTTCHYPLWQDMEQRDTARKRGFLRQALRAFKAYPYLVWRYLRAPAHDAVLVAYPGLLDLLVIWPFARLRRAKLVYDGFLPLYEMLVEDRALLPPASLRAQGLRLAEWLLHRLPDMLLADTQAHGRYLQQTYGLHAARLACVPVGAQAACFPRRPAPAPEKDTPVSVLFFGYFIPLHGLDVLVEAAHALQEANEAVRFTLIGTGQEAARIDQRIRDLGLANVERIRHVPYEKLADHIHAADICLGIFGTGKASRVIPNKVYQILACGRPLVTRDSPAMRELGENHPWIRLCPPGDAGCLAEQILALREMMRADAPPAPLPRITEAEVGRRLRRALEKLPATDWPPEAEALYGPAFIKIGWVPALGYSLRRHLALAHLRPLPPGRVLEIGTATGAMLHELAGLGWHCTGVESSPLALAKAQRALEGGAQAIALQAALPPESEEYDCVMALEVLEHIKDDRAALSSWLARLKPGGLLVLSVPAHPRMWGKADEMAGHYRRYTKETLATLMQENHCEVEALYCYGWPLLNLLLQLRRLLLVLKAPKHEGKPPAPEQRTALSGIERHMELRFYLLYARGPGRLAFRACLWLQRRGFQKARGTGWLLIARRQPTSH